MSARHGQPPVVCSNTLRQWPGAGPASPAAADLEDQAGEALLTAMDSLAAAQTALRASLATGDASDQVEAWEKDVRRAVRALAGLDRPEEGA